jgi:hypothetical protein
VSSLCAGYVKGRVLRMRSFEIDQGRLLVGLALLEYPVDLISNSGVNYGFRDARDGTRILVCFVSVTSGMTRERDQEERPK